MAFKSPSQTSGTTGNKELKLEKENLQKEISNLGIQHERTAKDLKEIELRRLKVEDVKKELSQLEGKKKKLQAKCSDIGVEIGKGEKKLDTLKEQHTQKVAALNLEFSEKKKDLEDKLSESEDEINTVSKKLATLITKKEETEKKKNTLIKEVEELEKKVEILVKDCVRLGKIIKDLPEKEKEKTELEGSIVTLKISKTSLENKTKELHKEMVGISNRVAKVKEGAEKFEKNKEAIRTEFNEKMKKETEALDKRDGLVSEKEGWIEQKEKDLRRAKAELEKFYNRKIPHVVI